MHENTESGLIARFKGGDISVFDTLARMWYDRVLGFLYRVLGDIDEAQDVCQQTFITVYYRLNTLNDDGKFPAWIYRIANNHAIDHIRNRKASFRGDGQDNAVGQDGASEPSEPHPLDLEAGVDSKSLQKVFETAFDTIPEEQRAVIVMKLYQDLKFTEIAEALDISVNTVKTRMYSGLRAMKTLLSDNKVIKEILKDAM